MKSSLAIAIALSLALSAAHATAADSKKGGNAALVPAGDVKFNDVPGFAGVKMAVLEGDPAKGAHHSMLKFTPGFSAPLHHHTANHFGIVVAGTLVLTVDGKETKLPPGSYFSFRNKQQHMTKCDAGAECVLSMDVRGKWDVVPEKDKTAAKK
jgi:quercetin dioxygenase-like cupin family protein